METATDAIMKQQSDVLCLFCSSTLLPRQQGAYESRFPKWSTPCCLQPICESCLARNPRLLFYNPCLKCLTGVGALKFRKNPPVENLRVLEPNAGSHFVIVAGDGSDDSDEGEDLRSSLLPHVGTSDPPHGMSNGTTIMGEDGHAAVSQKLPLHPSHTAKGSELLAQRRSGSSSNTLLASTSEYYIKSKDTLRGIALRLGVDARKLCVLNKLPISTLSTSPQLLHTLTILKLPPETKIPSPPPSPDELRRIEMNRVGKRIQLVTKEADWRVAKTYAALTELDMDDPPTDIKEKPLFKEINDSTSMAERAINAYYEDNAWEKEMRRHGAHGVIPGFPYFMDSTKKA